MTPKTDKLLNPTTLPQISVSRVFDAPVELVFRMWSDPKYLAMWWGPKNNINLSCAMDVRPGGAIRITMQMENGQLVQVTGIFNEVDAPHRLVFTTLKDENGNAGLEVLHTVNLTEANGQTKLSMHVAIIKTAPEFRTSCQGMELGWNQSLDRLAEQLILTLHNQ